jgi:heat shock protein HtpX
MANLYTHQDANTRKTFLLMTGFFLFVIALGFLFSRVTGNPAILVGAVFVSILMNFVAYWFSDSIALSMAGAHLLKRDDHVELFRIVENLTITAGLPMPRVYMIPGAQINAFATGRDAKHAAIAVTVGALEKLQKNELEGVLAHELSHIGNRDILVSTVVIVLAGVISIMADWFLRVSIWNRRSDDRDSNAGGIMIVLALASAILAPLAATLIQLAVSRKRELLADTSGVLLTRYPEGLASALEKISLDGAQLPHANTAMSHLYLANPFRGKSARTWITKLFMTHPPLEDRIRILRDLKM